MRAIQTGSEKKCKTCKKAVSTNTAEFEKIKENSS